MKALQAFELIWNILAVIYLVRMIQTSRFIPQHQDLAGTVSMAIVTIIIIINYLYAMLVVVVNLFRTMASVLFLFILKRHHLPILSITT